MNLLFDKKPVVLDRKLASKIGLNEAIILQQIHYWLEINKRDKRNKHKGKHWTYNTISEWQEEFPFWSKETVKRTFKKLRELGLIIVDNFNVYKMDRTLWYSIDYEKLKELLDHDFLEKDDSVTVCESKGSKRTIDDSKREPMERSKKTPAIPESTSEISTENNQSIKREKTDRPTERTSEFHDDFEKIIKSCELYAVDEKYRDAVSHAVKLLYIDSLKDNRIQIGDNTIPSQMLKEDLAKLNLFIVEFAVDKFKASSKNTEIRNPIAYLKTCIYNSINEMDIGIDSRLRFNDVID